MAGDTFHITEEKILTLYMASLDIDYSLRLLEKQNALHLPVFSIFFFSMIFPEHREIRSKK